MYIWKDSQAGTSCYVDNVLCIYDVLCGQCAIYYMELAGLSLSNGVALGRTSVELTRELSSLLARNPLATYARFHNTFSGHR